LCSTKNKKEKKKSQEKGTLKIDIKYTKYKKKGKKKPSSYDENKRGKFLK